MPRLATVVAFFVFLVLPARGAAETVDDLTFITEDYPPYNYVENDRLQGFGVDILMAMLEELGASTTREDIKVLAWAKGYQMAQEQPNTVLFVTSRTPGREALFQWVGPMGRDSMVLIGLKERDIAIESDADMNKYFIGAVRDDAGDVLLLEHGVSEKNIDRCADPEALISKLLAGRIDLWSYDEPTAFWLLRRHGVDSSRFETVHMLNEGGLYYAVSPATSKHLVDQLQTALEAIRQPGPDGTPSVFERIMSNYR